MSIANTAFLTSMTRGTGWSPADISHRPLPRELWANGDFVLTEMVSASNALARAELANGRMIDIVRGDRLVGALGRRAATLECVGDFAATPADELLDLMTPAGLLGKITSQSSYLGQLPILRYVGHVTVQGQCTRLKDYVGQLSSHTLKVPVVLVVGTSMSAGKTATARTIIRLLKQSGMRVAAAKLTGAARYRDVLSMQDAGADHIVDFVDAGLPSTICPPDEYRTALELLLGRIAMTEVDVLVAEAGASPLEPYNGGTALALLEPHIRFMALAASDPYAALGVISAFARKPDLVTGIATNTSAGIELVQSLTGLPAFNILEESSWAGLRDLLAAGLQGPGQRSSC